MSSKKTQAKNLKVGDIVRDLPEGNAKATTFKVVEISLTLIVMQLVSKNMGNWLENSSGTFLFKRSSPLLWYKLNP